MKIFLKMHSIIFLACLFLIYVQAQEFESNTVWEQNMMEVDLEEEEQRDIKVIETKWKRFKTGHRKTYRNKKEENYRKNVFAKNHRFVTEHNLRADMGQESFKLNLNSLSDLTHDEYKKMSATNITTIPSNLDKTLIHTSLANDTSDLDEDGLPSYVDLRERGFVTPVKFQGNCGSCWSFAATGALEGHYFRKTGKLISMSEQYLIDCSVEYDNNGCKGGAALLAFKFANDYWGIQKEKAYPYKAKEQECPFYLTMRSPKGIPFKLIANKDEEAMKEVIAKIGPLAATYDATSQYMQFFSKDPYDIFAHPNCSQEFKGLRHQVLIVGYGTVNNIDYWLIKNSWGEKWGDKGYFKIARNMNMCGIANQVTYPIL